MTGQRTNRTRGVVVALALAGVLGWAMPSASAMAAQAQQEQIAAAFTAFDKKRYEQARKIAIAAKDPLAAKLIAWMDLTRTGSDASFAEITAFLSENPDWPSHTALRRRAEEVMPAALSATDVLAWFEGRTPLTVDGRIRLAEALLETGRRDEAREHLRRTWIEGNFGHLQERRFYERYRSHLGHDDHVERVERLIWEDRTHPAQRMLWRLKPDYRALAEARIMLGANKGNVDQAIAKVPAELQDHPGLLYERMRWRRRKGRDLAAREILDPGPEPDRMMVPEKWWTERSILARRALREGHVSEAYRMVAGHGVAGGVEFAEGEWLAGWIALRFLDEPKAALDHFARMHEGVNFPISRARAAYWAGQAAGKLGREEQAREWLLIAAGHATTFYGQRAAAELGRGDGLDGLSSPHQPTEAERTEFDALDLTRAVRLLARHGQDEPVRAFVRALYGVHATPGWRTLTAELTHEIARPDLGVQVAKMAERDGSFVANGYPVVSLPAGVALEKPLIHALIRQESAFNSGAVSSAGARGLMQLMPATARTVAKSLDLRYGPEKLTSDPEFNIKLGSAYLGDLLKSFDGSYILALGAYNAGPGRVREWIRQNGDSRQGEIDEIDWIELIPFSETRSYIQRVLENLHVYRATTAATELAERQREGTGR